MTGERPVPMTTAGSDAVPVPAEGAVPRARPARERVPSLVLAVLRLLPWPMRRAVIARLLRVLRSPHVATALMAVRRGPVRRALDRSPWFSRYEGYTAYQRGDFSTAAEALERACRLDASSPGAWLGLARARKATGETASAFSAAMHAVELSPDSEPAAVLAADLAVRSGDRNRLRTLLQLPSGLAAAGAGRLRLCARVALHADELEVARTAAEALLELDPFDETGLVTVAEVALRCGDRQAGVDVVDRLADASDQRAVRARVRLLVSLGQGQEALTVLDERPVATPALLRSLGSVLYDQGHLTAALDCYDRALSDNPLDATAAAWSQRLREELSVLRGQWRPTPGTSRSPVEDGIKGRVLHVVGRSLPAVQNGYAIRTQSVVQSQLAVGLDPHVVSALGFPEPTLSGPRREIVDGVPHHRLLDGRGRPLGLEERLDRGLALAVPLVREVRPAVLHPAADYQNAVLALGLRDVTGLPVVYEARGFWEESWLSRRDEQTSENSDQFLLRRSIETECMLRADHVVTLADVMRDDILARGVPPERVTVIPNAVDVDAFVPVERDPGLAQRWGIDPGDVVVGYISSLVPYEGIDLLVRACAELASSDRRVRLLVVGDGPERDSLERLASELLDAGQAVFTGRVPHDLVLAYYGLIDLFVVPRRPDRVCRLVTPLKPYEAMATGRAVIVSSVEALLEMVRPGETGESFEAGSVTSLCETLGRLIDDKEHRAELGKAARAYVCEHRTWRANADRYLALYEQLGVA